MFHGIAKRHFNVAPEGAAAGAMVAVAGFGDVDDGILVAGKGNRDVKENKQKEQTGKDTLHKITYFAAIISRRKRRGKERENDRETEKGPL